MYQEILRFWFEEIDQSLWWSKDDQFDRLILERFSDIYANAIRCELFELRKIAQGRLAEIIVLDQFSWEPMEPMGSDSISSQFIYKTGKFDSFANQLQLFYRKLNIFFSSIESDPFGFFSKA